MNSSASLPKDLGIRNCSRSGTLGTFLVAVRRVWGTGDGPATYLTLMGWSIITHRQPRAELPPLPSPPPARGETSISYAIYLFIFVKIMHTFCEIKNLSDIIE
jgi:hypothetical protein